MTRSTLWLACLAMVSALIVGCGPNPPAKFKVYPATEALIPQARDAVTSIMMSHFGEPENLVAWKRLTTVRFGGVLATVSDDEANPPKTGEWILEIDGDTAGLPPIEPGDKIVWLNGKRVTKEPQTTAPNGSGQVPVPSTGPTGTPDTVLTYDANTKKLAVSTTAKEPPGTGDELLIGDGRLLARGRVVYQKNCMHCHGTTGDGNGPTAKYMNPKPRDYRLGIFKFTSTQATERVTRDDLTHILAEGVPGTYMPSFKLMPDDDVTAVVEYVRWLAIRGEFEKRIDDELADFRQSEIDEQLKRSEDAYREAVKNKEEPPKRKTLDELMKSATDDWNEYRDEDLVGTLEDTADFLVSVFDRAERPESQVVPKQPRTPAEDQESIKRGEVLYLSDKTKCYTCHGMKGRGDGPAILDFWPKPGTDEKYAKPGLHDIWGEPLPPRDLTRGQYRGGRRPIDLYRRLYAGIKGTPMPAFGGTTLSDAEIWDLVNYVMHLQYATQTPLMDRPDERHAKDNGKASGQPLGEAKLGTPAETLSLPSASGDGGEAPTANDKPAVNGKIDATPRGGEDGVGKLPSGESQPAGDMPADKKPAENKAPDDKSMPAKPADSKPVETKSDDAKADEAKPEMKPEPPKPEPPQPGTSSPEPAGDDKPADAAQPENSPPK